MGSLEGVYEGRIISLGDGNATAFVPQVFGDTQVTISDFLVPVSGVRPGMGWVSFQAGDPEHPVWLSGASGGTGGDGDGGEIPGLVSFVHNQATTDNVWNIPHNLGWFPNVTVVDSGGSVVEGEIVYLTANSLRLIFSGAFSGIAYLS